MPGRSLTQEERDAADQARRETVEQLHQQLAEGIANLDAICATKGLDAVYIGPADLSFALGLPPRGDNPDPLHMATCDKILAAAHKAKVVVFGSNSTTRL